MNTQNQNQPDQIVNMKCRNPTGKCQCMTAVIIFHPSKSTRLYQCTKCKHTWPISVGGEVNLNGL